jgi:cell division inhibitor SepF
MSSFFGKLKEFVGIPQSVDDHDDYDELNDYAEDANNEPLGIEGEKIYAPSWNRPSNNMGSERSNVIGMPFSSFNSTEVIQEIEQIFMELGQSDTRIKNDQADIEKLKVETRSILANIKQF